MVNKIQKGLGLVSLVLSLYSCGSDNTSNNNHPNNNCYDCSTDSNVNKDNGSVVNNGNNNSNHSVNNSCLSNCEDAGINEGSDGSGSANNFRDSGNNNYFDASYRDNGYDGSTSNTDACVSCSYDGGDNNGGSDGSIFTYDAGSDSGTNNTHGDAGSDSNNDSGRDASTSSNDAGSDAGVTHTNHSPTVYWTDSNGSRIISFTTMIDRDETYSVHAEDIDGDTLSYNWKMKQDEVDTNQTTIPRIIYSYHNAGVYTAIINVSDGETSITDSLDVRVQNSQGNIPPYIDAGPDINNYPLNEFRCVNWGCDSNTLAGICQGDPFAPGHSLQGFNHGDVDGTIVDWHIDKDYINRPGLGTSGNGCYPLRYNNQDYHSGQIVTVRVKVTDNQGAVGVDTAQFILQ